jgi:hypothetical protein
MIFTVLIRSSRHQLYFGNLGVCSSRDQVLGQIISGLIYVDIFAAIKYFIKYVTFFIEYNYFCQWILMR